jgi:hypothetical protein
MRRGRKAALALDTAGESLQATSFLGDSIPGGEVYF